MGNYRAKIGIDVEYYQDRILVQEANLQGNILSNFRQNLTKSDDTNTTTLEKTSNLMNSCFISIQYDNEKH